MLLSQYSSQPNVHHMGAAKRVLRYVKGTRNLKLIYRRTESIEASRRLIGYADSDFANDVDDHKSVSGYMFMLNECNTISWRSKKRTHRVATSTLEAELHALSYTSKHLLWLQEALRELQTCTMEMSASDKQNRPLLYSDNQGTLNMI